MTNDNVLRKFLCSTIAGGMAAGAGGTVLGTLGTGLAAGVGSVVFTPIAPIVAGIGASVTIGSFISRLLDD